MKGGLLPRGQQAEVLRYEVQLVTDRLSRTKRSCSTGIGHLRNLPVL